MNLLTILFLSHVGLAQSQNLIPTQTFLSDESYSSFFLGKEFSGGDSVGGGDNVDGRRHAAWFYGTSEISVCYQLSEYFGVSSDEVENNVQQAIHSWAEYFEKKKIGKNLAPSLRINFNFILKKRCEGGEDLVLYLGTGPIFGNLDDLRARQMLSRPVAYVNKTHISQDLNWSKGYIRFVEPEIYYFKDQLYFPDWKKGSSFYNLLLHEFGHLLGFEHKDGTVMKKTISLDNLVTGLDSIEKSKIDQLKTLYYCLDCVETFFNSGTTAENMSFISIKPNQDLSIYNKDNKNLKIKVQGTLVTEKHLNLLSFIAFSNYEYQKVYLYFIEIKGLNYTLEIKDFSAILRFNGKEVAQFIKEQR